MYRLIIACIIGIIIGVFLPVSLSVDNLFSVILPVLLFSVGFSISEYDIKKIYRKNKRFLLLPIASLLGSLLIAVLYTIIFDRDMQVTLANAGAMGFYSLPAIMLTNSISVIAATMLLLTNMLREIFVILLAPLLVKIFGRYSVIAIGGATTMDVSLPVIKETGGEDLIPVAILNGLVLTIVVPFVISLILYINF